MEYFVLVLMAILGYLFGSLNFAVVIGKLFYKTDVREFGSKNAGATNVLRTLGKKAALFVTIGDMLKGIVAFLIAKKIGEYYNMSDLYSCVAGVSAVLGHNFPLYFNFKGGKGVLTSLGLSFMIDYRGALIALAVFILLLIFTKYVSLSSIMGCIANAIVVCFLLPDEKIKIWVVIILALLAIIKHMSNIKRLIKGEENKIGKKA